MYFSCNFLVSKETLRLSPFPFPLWKTCTESVELTDYNGKTLLVEKGTKLILPINALHSHPDYYGNPEKFDPDRFDESKGGIKRLKDAGVFMPFGNGPRQCLGKFCLKVKNSLRSLKDKAYIFSEKFPGMRFAVVEIKAALFNLIGKFEFSLEPNNDPPSLPVGSLFFSQNPAKLRIKRLVH